MSAFHPMRTLDQYKSKLDRMEPPRGNRPCDGLDDLSIFDLNHRDDILETIHARFVLVALNVSQNPGTPPWSNFHSGKRDFMLRDAVMGTALWGSYLTDIIKNLPEKNSGTVAKYLKDKPEVLDCNIECFRRELEAIGAAEPILVALGGTTGDILRKAFGTEYRICQMHHYSGSVTRDKLRWQALQIAGELPRP
jgi:hypothetical protein